MATKTITYQIFINGEKRGKVSFSAPNNKDFFNVIVEKINKKFGDRGVTKINHSGKTLSLSI